MTRYEETAFDQYAASALQALISKLPLLDRDGEYSEKVESDDLQAVKQEIARSALEYAFYMVKNRKEFMDALHDTQAYCNLTPPQDK